MEQIYIKDEPIAGSSGQNDANDVVCTTPDNSQNLTVAARPSNEVPSFVWTEAVECMLFDAVKKYPVLWHHQKSTFNDLSEEEQQAITNVTHDINQFYPGASPEGVLHHWAVLYYTAQQARAAGTWADFKHAQRMDFCFAEIKWESSSSSSPTVSGTEQAPTTGGPSNPPQEDDDEVQDLSTEEFQAPHPPPPPPPPQRVSICLDVFPKPSTSTDASPQPQPPPPPQPEPKKRSGRGRRKAAARVEDSPPVAKRPRLRPIAPAPTVTRLGGGAGRPSVLVVMAQPTGPAASSSSGATKSGSNDKREALCELATQQVQFAFKLQEASEEEKVKLYLKLSQLCTNYIAEGL